MPRRGAKIWTEKEMESAIEEVESFGRSCRSTAAKYNINESVIRFRIKLRRRGQTLGHAGRKPELDEETERNLAKCVGALCNIGFSPTQANIQRLVQQYMRTHGLKSRFKDDMPGRVWLKGFMKRHHLSLKKANMISAARKSATSNPFVIYDFYDTIEDIVRQNKLQPGQVWNCDETSFSSDPRRCRVVGVRGKSAMKITSGAGRLNTTVLAACSASGQALAPLVVFTGKSLQSTWKATKPLPDILYGYSDNGWMTSEVFSDWFKVFVKRVTTRPLLLILDGHATHVTLDVIEKAIAEKVIIVKLPPHVTDVLQPLDVCCFGPLKRLWDKILNDWTSAWGGRLPIVRSLFVDKLCEIWYQGLSVENVVSGFSSTGLFPVDRSKFPINRLDNRLLKRYQKWVSDGKPESEVEDLALSVNTPQKHRPEPLLREAHDSDNAVELPSTSTPQRIAATPPPTSRGKWVKAWVLLEDGSEICTHHGSEKSFEDVLLDQIKGPVEEEGKKKRRKIDLKTKVITEEQFVKEIREKDKKAQNSVKKQKITTLDDDSSDSDSDQETTSDVVTREIVTEMKNTWIKCSTIQQENIKNTWLGAIYTHKRKDSLYVGRVVRRFLADAGGPATAIELDCLKPHVGPGNILESVPDHLPRDVDVFPLSNIIAGPLDVQPHKGKKWKIENYEKLRDVFTKVSKMNRSSLVDEFTREWRP